MPTPMFSLYRLLTVGLPLLMVSVLHYLSPTLYVAPDALRSNPNNANNNNDNAERHWCMLTRDLVPKNDKWFATIEHFPHTLEWFAHCWNWVQSENNNAGSNVKGGFIVDEYVHKKLQRKYWNRAFFPAMEWPVEVISSTNSTQQQQTMLEYDKISTDYYHGSGWFQREGMCDSFRQRMWHNFGVEAERPKHHSKKNKRIGIVNRNESRSIVDVDRLVQQLHARYKHSDVEVRTIESEYQLTREEDTLEAQAKWFADKDLVIMAHGAAMSNVVFMRPGSALMELYPKYYFNDMFWDLMTQCGVHHDWYYDNGAPKTKVTEKFARAETTAHWGQRSKNKKRDISYEWKDVDRRIHTLLKKVDA